jgi:nicotinamidase-related amidase
MIQIDPKSAALVLIDLQNGILDIPLAPRSGPDILNTSKVLAERFRSADARVVLVNVAWSDDFGDTLRQRVDQRNTRHEGGFPAGWSNLCADLARPGDLLITKRQWGAFYGTELDLQLRRRGVQTIVLAGVATNFGVESTARQGWEHGYEIIIVEDATTSVATELHEVSIKRILPLIARVTTSDSITFAGA